MFRASSVFALAIAGKALGKNYGPWPNVTYPNQTEYSHNTTGRGVPGSVTLCSGYDADPGPYPTVNNTSNPTVYNDQDPWRYLGCVWIHFAVTACVKINQKPYGFPVKSLIPDVGGYCLLFKDDKCGMWADLDSNMKPITYPGLSHPDIELAESINCFLCEEEDCARQEARWNATGNWHLYPQVEKS